ncbi:MAG TPA: hypothetical protein VFN09_14035, partial [Rhodanobacteraceae bacterium]|nr:hypothetical protein [Rhodanobacteraceae bacterium]
MKRATCALSSRSWTRAFAAQPRRLTGMVQCIVAGIAGLLAGSAMAASTWTVTTTQDDAAPGVACNANNSCYTLRDAVFSANPGD